MYKVFYMIFAIGRGFMMSPDLMDELMAEIQGKPP